MAYNWLWARYRTKPRCKTSGKPLMGNTRLVVSHVSPTREWETDETVYAVRHWHTEVVRYYPNGVGAASLNGWNTITTKKRVRRFSPLQLGSDRGQIMAYMGGYGGQRWIGCEDTWFFWKEGRLVFQDGGNVPNLLHARRKDTIPKGRDTLVNTKEGDAFRDGSGCWVLAENIQIWPRRLQLYPYLGDHPDDRGLCVTTPDMEPRALWTPLELLASAVGEGLKPINRFLWKNPTERA